MVGPPDILKFDQVSHTYGGAGELLVPAINNLSFTVPAAEKGEFLAILGPSGCGKSTILNMIAGLLQPTSGTVSIQGQQVLGPDANTVTVQQAYTCLPWRSVLGNVTFGLEIEGKSSREAREIAERYIEMVDLTDRMHAMPKELSGGMQQRVAIARALAMRRPILVMDEPFGALDAHTRAGMQELIVDLWQKEKSLIIFVTHDILEALLLADRIIGLSARPASVVLDTMVSFERPRTLAIQSQPNFKQLYQAILNLLRSPQPPALQGTPKE